MCDVQGDLNIDDLMGIADFMKHFDIHYSLLLRRYNRYLEINRSPTDDIDVITYFDMIIVQIRALCIESSKHKNNYTAQVLLRKVGKPSLADKIDVMLATEFLPATIGFPFSKAIKTLADGFICHYDNFDGIDADGWALAIIIEQQLRNPYNEHNLDYVMNCLIRCIGDGLSILI